MVLLDHGACNKVSLQDVLPLLAPTLNLVTFAIPKDTSGVLQICASFSHNADRLWGPMPLLQGSPQATSHHYTIAGCTSRTYTSIHICCFCVLVFERMWDLCTLL